MQFSFIDSALIVLGILLMAVPGYLLIKLHILKTEAIGNLAKITLYACQPMLMISSFQKASYDKTQNSNILKITLLILSIYIIMLLLCSLFSKVFREKRKARVFAFGSVFGNVGFMGIPVISALMPDSQTAMLYTAIGLAIFNLLAFTIGIFVITGDKKYISIRKALFNPTMIGVFIGLALFFTNVKLPSFIAMPVSTIGNLCIPLTMLMLGMRFATAKFSSLFTNMGVYASVIVKLVIMPLLVYLIMLPFDFDSIIKAVVLITMSMPCANIVLMFAEVYDCDSLTASNSILLSTLLSIITVPLLLLLL